MSLLESPPVAPPIAFTPPRSITGVAAPSIVITLERSITGSQAETLWEAYRTNFEPLAELAILQHLYSKDEVLAEFRNPNIIKIVGWQDDRPVGLAMVTNRLDEVPQISPAFLRGKYPQHAARNAIYFGILVMVVPGTRGLTLFGRLSTELWQLVAVDNGVLVYDVCDFNRTTFSSEKVAQRIADSFPRSNLQVIDRQTWFAAELPEPLPGYPRA